MSRQLLKGILKKKSLGIKSLAVLIDPDYLKLKNLNSTCNKNFKIKNTMGHPERSRRVRWP